MNVMTLVAESLSCSAGGILESAAGCSPSRGFCVGWTGPRIALALRTQCRQSRCEVRCFYPDFI